MQLTLAPSAPITAQGAALRRPGARQQRRAAPLAVRATATGGSATTGGSAGGQAGLYSNNSGLLGPKAPGSGSASLGSPLSSSKAAGPSLDEVELKSGVGVNYATLRDLLKERKWREAEDETRELLIQSAGAGAVKRGWVYFSEVKTIPVEDLRCLDELWRAASNGKFGYSVQREIWVQQRRQWTKFFKAIDWVQGENNVYRKWPSEFMYTDDAPRGHLPLTNALRGTRLFEAILEHPAFDKSANTIGGSSNGAAQPGWLDSK